MERKLATVLFVDLVGSTALVTGTDPEIARRRVQQYFDKVSHCVMTHGGIVEKFAGDAVMAAFGIPQAHEDDAERAVRAALGILESVRELGLDVRIGIESGEVVVDDETESSTFATGEAVNIAARLQQAAPVNTIMIGQGAHRLTLGRFEVEDEGPVEIRGRAEPVWAWRVICVAGGRARPGVRQAPLVGREEELELLENTYSRAVRDHRAHLFTIYGDPGVGKSRLANEFVGGLEGATVLFGRALPYGEGVTYSALSDMVKTAAGIADDDPLDDALEKLRDCCPDEAVADLLALASGVLEAVKGERNQQEIAWAAREWAEKLAEPQPLVLVFEDIHWAEDALLELIEHMSTWVKNVPILLLCLARPELLDLRPGWSGGRVRATAIELEPLGRTDSEALVEALLDGELGSGARQAVLDKSEGNPLFVEETVRMLSEANGGGIERIPDTLQALIAARIDHLPPGEKELLQGAAVMGRIFWKGALAELVLEGTDIDPLLEDLHLREIVLPETRSSISGQDAFKFKHVMIREVAYGGLSKAARAGYHQRFAEWLRKHAGEELLEVRAYHLDHATALLAELDGSPPKKLATEAAAALEEAGRRALAREANAPARKLLIRAVELEPTLERRFQAARAAWRMSEFPVVSPEMQEVLRLAREAGDKDLEARALVALAEVSIFREGDVSRGEELAREALEVAERDESKVFALEVLNTVAWWRGRLTEGEGYAQEQLEIARRLGRADLESEALLSLAGIYTSRQEDARAEPLIERAKALAEESGSLTARAHAYMQSGELYGWRRRDDEALEEYERARELFAEVGAATYLAKAMLRIASIVRRAGDLEEAEKLAREGIRILKPLEDRGTLCEVQRFLAEVLLEQGKLDEAELYALKAVETVGPQDVSSQASTKTSLALVRASQGRDEEAEALLHEAIEILERSEYSRFLSDPLEAMIQFLEERERFEEIATFERRLEELRAGDVAAESAA
ncbi:MAG TPA: adenylate/guanylate cyclase domain-containing protein [Gaiellaceae bacterium]|nr:adenylate/guanylate cyclase domain-containing protein [Gaiellaceae bacterium]